MASNYTENLNLCQWAAEDPVLREDFNADNQKLEAAYLALRSAPNCVTGSYIGGTNSDTVTVDVGFRPSFLVIFADRSNVTGSQYVTEETILLAAANCYAIIPKDDHINVFPSNIFTENGFSFASNGSDALSMNAAGVPYYYAAFH